jgi:hypothetical protein
MFYLGLVLFVLGFAAYVVALFHIGDPDGETFSDVGNALMLTATVLLLLRLSWVRKAAGGAKSKSGADAPRSNYQA